MARLYLNNVLVPLGGDPIAPTLTADSLETANSVQSTYSNSFEVPLSAELRQAIGNIQAQSADGNEYANIPARFENDELTISGFANVREVGATSVTLVLFEGAADLFDELGELTLQMLPVSSLRTTANPRTTANVKAGLQNDYTDGYTYAFANFGTDDGTTINTDSTAPITFLHKIMQAVIARTSYTLDTSTGLMADAFFRKCASIWNASRYNEGNYMAYDVKDFNITAGSVPAGQYVTIKRAVTLGSAILLDSGNAFSGEYRAGVDNRRALIFNANCDITITTDAGNYEYNLAINVINGATGAVVTDLVTYSSGAQTGAGATVNVSHELITELTNAGLNEGDRIAFQIDAVTGLNFEFTAGYFRNDDGRQAYAFTPSKAVSNVNPYANPPAIASGTLVSAIDDEPLATMPDMLCRDFIKGVLQLFGARLSIDTAGKLVSIVMFKDYTATAGAPDWSSKVFLDGDFSIEYRYGNYAATNILRYGNDDTVPEALGQGIIELSNPQVNQSDYTMVEVPFGASISKESTIYIPAIVGAISFNSGYQEDELSPRVCYIEATTATATVDDGTTSDTQANANGARFIYEDDSQTLNFASSIGLIANYYAEFSAMLASMELVTVRLLLNGGDFGGLNFFEPKYIAFSDGLISFNGYYLLQEITEYRGSEPALCELVNLNIT